MKESTTNDDESGTEADQLLVGRQIEKLQELDTTRESILTEYQKERAALEAKYNSIYSSLYQERARIVSGTEDKDNKEASTKKRSKGIPHFWVSAMSNMETVGAMIAEDDVDCLAFLKDIVCVDDPDGKGFTLQFYFDDSNNNPYFDNQLLTKRYEIPNLLLGDDAPELKNVIGCDIQWKEGKCLTHQTVTKQQRGKGKHAGQLRTVSRQEPKDSFFHWFAPPKMPPMEEMNEELAEQLEASFAQDYDVAQAFRMQIIPKAIRWFAGGGEDDEDDEEQVVDDEDDDEEREES